MSDYTANTPHARSRKGARAEFAIYFGVIFIVALPFALLAWLAQVVRTRRLPARDPISRAWAEAQAITPQIFLA
jgi:hypothetical protein